VRQDHPGAGVRKGPVDFDEDNIPSLLKFIEMERYLEKLLRKKVDLVMKSGIRSELKGRILEEVVYI
jgi:uncharacterized protein